MTQELDKLPMIGDVPVLGALFTSEQFRRNETELVILITPYLVKPSRGRRMATPLDRPPPPAVAPVRTASEPPRSSGLILK